MNTTATRPLDRYADDFFHYIPMMRGSEIVNGPERWTRALAGKKRDIASMRMILEYAHRQAQQMLYVTTKMLEMLDQVGR